jgi:hypothetical protein
MWSAYIRCGARARFPACLRLNCPQTENCTVVTPYSWINPEDADVDARAGVLELDSIVGDEVKSSI